MYHTKDLLCISFRAMVVVVVMLFVRMGTILMVVAVAMVMLIARIIVVLMMVLVIVMVMGVVMFMTVATAMMAMIIPSVIQPKSRDRISHNTFQIAHAPQGIPEVVFYISWQ